jgi:UDP-sugar pyrophosphorylase
MSLAVKLAATSALTLLAVRLFDRAFPNSSVLKGSKRNARPAVEAQAASSQEAATNVPQPTRLADADVERLKEVIGDNFDLLNDAQRDMCLMLIDNDQPHLISHWPKRGRRDADKRRFLKQCFNLDEGIVGGIKGYLDRAKVLIRQSQLGENPMEGLVPSVPQGARLAHDEQGKAEFEEMEALGIKESARTAFVIVAGGLGERLGYAGIKLALPIETATENTYLQRYVETILAMQNRAHARGENVVIPLVIMTSDDTHGRTLNLLKINQNFGMAQGQITLIKQEKVPSLMNAACHIALDKQDKYSVYTKPHGHGDVHGLLYQSGIAQMWADNGIKWVVFLQDTNGLVFNTIPAALGVSATHNMVMNSIAVRRRPGEAVGAITKMTNAQGKSMTINVEYNQFNPVLAASGMVDECDENGFSLYPGNINTLIFSCKEYAETLEATSGVIAEFVNPKYADEKKQKFKKWTRLECMMQDFPKCLPESATVGFSEFERDTYSPVKNNAADAKKEQEAGRQPASACEGEANIYRYGRKMLADAGAEVEVDTKEFRSFQGISTMMGAMVSILPSWALTWAEVRQKLKGNVKISNRSTLVIDGENITIDGLDLDGALVIRAAPGTQVSIKNLKVVNKGWELIDVGEEAKDKYMLRGYFAYKHETEIVGGERELPAESG